MAGKRWLFAEEMEGPFFACVMTHYLGLYQVSQDTAGNLGAVLAPGAGIAFSS